MRRTYQLIKLRTSTVKDLKRLRARMGKASLDELITSMICIMEAHRESMKSIGWGSCGKRWNI